MTFAELAARQGARTFVQQPPSEHALWALSQSDDLDAEQRRVLDDAIAWALVGADEKVGSDLRESQVVGCMLAMALADGTLSTEELRVLARTLRRMGRAQREDFQAVRRAFVSVAEGLARDGLGPVLDRFGASVETDVVRVSMLRLAALVLVADHALSVAEPQALRRLGVSIDATEQELVDAILGAHLGGGLQ